VRVDANIEFDAEVFERLRKEVREAGQKHVHVGVLASKGGSATGPDGETTIAEIAAIHEYGAPKAGIPARSFIRATIEGNENREALSKMLEKLARAVLSEKSTIDKALSVLGMWAVSAIKKRITDRIPPELQAATVKRKGGKDVPLVDHGQLINSINWEVDK
jgi:phage gpG-like protein